MFDPWSPANSVLREKLVEHMFIAELARHLMTERKVPFEILRAEFDASGYDIVIEVDGIPRHIQLKAGRADGKRTEVGIHTLLAAKPGGCVIWIMVDPATFTLGPFYWYGGPPGSGLPELGDRLVKHSKANAEGFKAHRPALRLVRRTAFRKVLTIAGLSDELFGVGV